MSSPSTWIPNDVPPYRHEGVYPPAECFLTRAGGPAKDVKKDAGAVAVVAGMVAAVRLARVKAG